MFDTLIRNALIVDGTGKPPFTGDLGIQDGRIAGLGSVHASEASGRLEIDAAGLVAVPGFIDMHSHTDLQYFRPQSPEEKVRQGITTELLGQDGLGTAPLTPENLDEIAGLAAGLQGTILREQWTWRTFSEYLQALGARGLPNNAAVLVSHAPIRMAAMQKAAQPASQAEIMGMQTLIREAMQAGAFGFSTGLIYPPNSYSTTEELIALNQIVAEYGGIFVVHQRDEAYNLRKSFAELVEIARATGVHLHVSHLQAIGGVSWPFIDTVLEMADQLLADGGQITWDRYPYLAGCTVLSAVLPPWAFNDGPEALVENLKDPNYRQKIHAEFCKGLDVWSNRSILLGWSKVTISGVASEKNRWMEGQDIQSLAQICGKDPVDFICDLLAEEALDVKMISHYGSEQVLAKILCHRQATVGTDGIYGGRPHPRLFGTYPRFLEKFVQAEQKFALEEGIRKITSFPAQILGLPGRGVLREGAWADIVLMDLERLGDRATYAQPEQYPAGIETVFVNGERVVHENRITGKLPGQVLRKVPQGVLA